MASQKDVARALSLPRAIIPHSSGSIPAHHQCYLRCVADLCCTAFDLEETQRSPRGVQTGGKRRPAAWLDRPLRRLSAVGRRRCRKGTQRQPIEGKTPTKQTASPSGSAMASSQHELWIGPLEQGLVASPPSPVPLVAPSSLNSSQTTVGDVVAPVQLAKSKASRGEAQQRRQHERLRLRREPSPPRRTMSRSPYGRQANSIAPSGDTPKAGACAAVPEDIAQMSRVRELQNQSMGAGFQH